jgi:hypothetical protein
MQSQAKLTLTIRPLDNQSSFTRFCLPLNTQKIPNVQALAEKIGKKVSYYP